MAMKIEVGKFYKNLNGNKVSIIHKLNVAKYCFLGVISLEGTELVCYYDEDGTSYGTTNNIFSEWIEPVSVTKYICVSDNFNVEEGLGSFYRAIKLIYDKYPPKDSIENAKASDNYVYYNQKRIIEITLKEIQ
jgi:hypothetical protein